MRPWPGTRALVAALLCAATLACASGSGPGAPAAERPAPRLDPTFVPALTALEKAVRDGEDELARRILASILARGPEGETLAFVQNFENILEGRALVEALDLRLEAEAIGDGDRVRVLLVASHRLDETVELELAPSTLRHTRTSVLPVGFENRSAERVLLPDTLSALRIAPGETRVLVLEERVFVTGEALATRMAWNLATRAGAIHLVDTTYPAQHVPVRSLERVRLASWLPASPLPPEELARYLERPRVRVPALLERAVRIPVDRRGEALDLLTPVLAEAGQLRVQEAVPALRWLAGTGGPGGDPVAWRNWLESRARPEETGPRPSLDLPGALVPGAPEPEARLVGRAR